MLVNLIIYSFICYHINIIVIAFVCSLAILQENYS